MDRPQATPDDPAPANLHLRGLEAVDDVQQRIRDLMLAELPRVGLLRLVVFPSFLLLLGSPAARDQRTDGANDVLLAAYVVAVLGFGLAEQLRLQRIGLTSRRRRLPRAGRRQLAGAVAVACATIATAIGGIATDLPWLGLPFGLAVAAVSYVSRLRWAAAFRTAPALRLPGPDPGGPFQPPAALRLGAALALSDRVRPAVLEEHAGLPAGSLEAGVDDLAHAGLARALRPDPQRRTVVAFSRSGRRAWRRHIAALQAR